jgi:hypothetical protein
MPDLLLEIIQGPNAGQMFTIHLGDRIGNGFGESRAEIKIPTPNISSLHAKVIKDENNQLALVALNQSKFFIQNSKKVDQIILLPGEVFKIEELILKVHSAAGLPNNLVKQKNPLKLPLGNKNPRSALEELESGLLQCIDKSMQNIESMVIRPFQNPIQMRFTQGVQLEESIIIGWGPRSFGKNTYELTLTDPIALDLAFLLSPGLAGVCEFSTEHPEQIFINGHSTKKAVLSSGDKIQFGNNIIEVLELDYY